MAQIATLPTPACSEPPRNKIRKLTDHVVIQGPHPPPPQRSSDGECHVYIYKVTDDASLLWDDAKDCQEPLWQVQVVHDGRDSVVVNLYDKFGILLAETKGLPLTLQELKEQALIKLVITGTEDPDAVGTFVRWRCAFYVAGSESALRNFLYLLDDYWVHCEKNRQARITVQLHPHFGIDIDETWDNFTHENYVLHPPIQQLAVPISHAYPVQGKRIVTMTIQIGGEVSLVFTGALWAFRERSEQQGIDGYRHDNGEYYRILADLDLKDTARIDKIFTDVFSNLALRVLVQGEVRPGSAVHSFIQTLQDNPQLHFTCEKSKPPQ